MKKSKYLFLAIATFATTLACVSCDKDKTVEDSKEKQEFTTTDLSRQYGESMNLFVHVEKKGGTSGDAVLYDKARVVNGKIEGPTKYIDSSADSYSYYAWADCSGQEHEVEIVDGGIHFMSITKDDTQKIFVSPERNVPTKEFKSMMEEGLNKYLYFLCLCELMEEGKSELSVKEAEDGGYVVNFNK